MIERLKRLWCAFAGHDVIITRWRQFTTHTCKRCDLYHVEEEPLP